MKGDKNLRDAERKQLEHIERLGLKRVVFHGEGMSYRKCTIAYLVPKDDNKHWGETPEDTMFPQRNHDIRGMGQSKCSWKDTWNRRYGRVRATGIAIKSLNDKTEEEKK